MDSEQAFLQVILENPNDDTSRLVYADWLEERGDLRGEYIRVSLALANLQNQETSSFTNRAKLRRLKAIASLKARLRELRPSILPAWETQIIRGDIEHCCMVGDVECPMRWERLPRSSEAMIRICGECMRPVRYCRSVIEVRGALRAGSPVVKALVLE